MAAINKKYFFLDTDNYVDRPNSSTMQMIKPLINDKFDYWYCEFKDGMSLGHLKNTNVLDKESLVLIKSGKCRLIINNAHEAFHSVVKYIYKLLVCHMDIDPTNIILITESANIHEEIEKQALLYNKLPIKYVWHRLFEVNMGNFATYPKFTYTPTSKGYDVTAISTLQNKTYEKKFINLNRRWRSHRPIFVANLYLMNLLELGYVSMAKADDGRDWQFCLDVIESLGPQISSRFKGHEHEILNLPELKLDQDDMVTNHVYTFSNKLLSMIENTYFTVVSETSFFKEFDDSDIFLSEKIFKPIAMKHPFLVLSRPYTLKYLKEIGYKTFSGIINEEYDNELDDIKRMDLVLAEVKRLCSLTDTELENFLNTAREICKYNKIVLVNKTKLFNKSSGKFNPFFSYIENLI